MPTRAEQPRAEQPRAKPARIPGRSERQNRALTAERKRRGEVEARERRSMVRGLLLLALVVLILSIARAGLDRVFPQGWWHL